MVSYTKRAIKGAAIVFIMGILAAFLGYLLRLLLVRNISQVDYGLFYSVLTLTLFFEFFKDLGLGASLTKFIAEFKVKKRFDLIKSSIISVFLLQLLSVTVISILLVIFSDFLASSFFHNMAASLILKLLAASFWLTTFFDIFVYSFLGFQKMFYFSTLNPVKMFLILAMSFIFLKLGLGIMSPVLAYLIVYLIILAIYFPILTKKVFPLFFKEKFSFQKRLIKKLVDFGLPVMLSRGGGMLMLYTDTLFLTYFSGLTAVALYNVAMPTARLLTYFHVALGAVIFPLSSELWVKNHKEHLKQGIEQVYKYTFMTVMPLALVMFSFPQIIIRALFQESYVPASTTLQILSLAMLISVITGINSAVLHGIGKPKINTKITIAAASLNVALNLILVPHYGTVGAAVATLLSISLMLVLGTANIGNFIPVKIPLANWSKNLFIGMVFLALIYYLKKIIVLNVWLEMFIVVFIAGLAYTILLFALKLVKPEEIKEIIIRFQKG